MSFRRGCFIFQSKRPGWGFLGGSFVKNPPANAGDTTLSRIQEAPTCYGATKPVCPAACGLDRSPCKWNPAHHNHVAPTRRNERKASATTKAQHSREKSIHEIILRRRQGEQSQKGEQAAQGAGTEGFQGADLVLIKPGTSQANRAATLLERDPETHGHRQECLGSTFLPQCISQN